MARRGCGGLLGLCRRAVVAVDRRGCGGRVLQQLLNKDSKLPEIQISSALPKDFEPTEVHVIGETVIVLKTNQDYKWNITKNEITYSFAVWGNLIAEWYAFEPSSDAGHETIFWSIRKEGIFHSFDNSKWELKAEWFRE
ncbi:hypothetical protein ACB092_11G176400 [Castanea dentata]